MCWDRRSLNSLRCIWSNFFFLPTSEGRQQLAAAAAGTRVAFGGGEDRNKPTPNESYSADTWYDRTDGFQSTTEIASKILISLTQLFYFSLVFFWPVSLRNATDNKIYFEQLFRNRVDLAAAGDGTVMMFAGGTKQGVESNFVDIFDVASNGWTAANLGKARTQLAGAAINNVFVFAGG